MVEAPPSGRCLPRMTTIGIRRLLARYASPQSSGIGTGPSLLRTRQASKRDEMGRRRSPTGHGTSETRAMTRRASRPRFRAMGAFALLALVLPTSCRTIFPEWYEVRPRKVETPQQEQAHFDRCLASMPVLRGEPARPYHVLRAIEGQRESDLAWRACIEKADAVIADSPEGDASPARVADGRSPTAKRLVGRAIKYDEPPSGAAVP
jgi:hypothetical protein